MSVLVTGASGDIGASICKYFLELGHTVHGIDTQPRTLEGYDLYHHYIADVTDMASLPELEGVSIIVNNAGTMTARVAANMSDSTDFRDIEVNLMGTINVTERYMSEGIRSIVNIASASAHTGAEFPVYAASKGGVLAYTKHIAQAIEMYNPLATCNSVSPGGVISSMNEHLFNNSYTRKQLMKETLTGKWLECEEVAALVYFLTVINKSITGQDILIDNGEMLKQNFIW